jgi:hypothetical protein
VYFENGEWKAASWPITGRCGTRKPEYIKNCCKNPAVIIFVHLIRSRAYHDEIIKYCSCQTNICLIVML